MRGGPPVAVAVVSWNTRELLRGCLRSLADDAAAGRAEVWVVDNDSDDGSAEMASEEFGAAPGFRIVRAGGNLGFGPAVNLLAARTSTPWIAPANADVALEPGALAELLAAGRRDPAAGAVAPQLVLPDGSVQHSVYPFPTLRFTAAFNLGLLDGARADRLGVPGAWDPARPRRVDWAVGAFLLVRRAAWDAVGGFDERQWMFAEDLDLGWRLARAGWPTRYEPRARVSHHESAATGTWGEERTERWMASTYAWMLRRRGAAATRAVAAMNVAGAGARWAGLAARARLDGRRDGAGEDAAAARRWAALHRVGLAPRAVLEEHR